MAMASPSWPRRADALPGSDTARLPSLRARRRPSAVRTSKTSASVPEARPVAAPKSATVAPPAAAARAALEAPLAAATDGAHGRLGGDGERERSEAAHGAATIAPQEKPGENERASRGRASC